MELTEKEKELFMKHDKELKESPSFHVEDGLVQSYSEDDSKVQITLGYIKRILLEVAKKRGIDISEDIAFDIDELLKEIVEIPEDLKDFDPLYYKDDNKLKEFLKEKVKEMDSNDLETFLHNFTGIGGMNDSFREFMTQYIPTLINNIDTLYYEIDITPTENNIISLNDEELVEDISSDLSEDEIWGTTEIIEDEDFDWIASGDWEEFNEWENMGTTQNNVQDENTEITDEELIDYIRYINTYPLLIQYKKSGIRIANKLIEYTQKLKLSEFYSNKEFYENLKKIMEHDKKKHQYRFHGTQDLESATTIIQEGLGMIREDLSTTSYSEFSMDELILYSRGFAGEIGRDAIVIIDNPIEENGKTKDIVEPFPKDKKIHFVPSGLQGLDSGPNYIVDKKYIVGYVDKRNKKIVFNPRYYDYEKFGLDNREDLDVEER